MMIQHHYGRDWLVTDEISLKQRFSTVWHIDIAMKFVHDPQVVVQAGGNLGQWPLYLAPKFQRVYTFEPDPYNFRCLTANCVEPNVFAFRAALGAHSGVVNIATDAENCEASHIAQTGVPTPIVTIDRVVEDRVDLILLDVEGYELEALQGAKDTLEEWRPIVLVEDRHQVRYGHTIHDITAFLDGFGYKEFGRANKDIIYGYHE